MTTEIAIAMLILNALGILGFWFSLFTKLGRLEQKVHDLGEYVTRLETEIAELRRESKNYVTQAQFDYYRKGKKNGAFA